MSLQAALPRPTRFTIGRALGDSIGIFARNAIWLVPVACAARAVVLLAPEPAEDGGPPDWQDLFLGNLSDALASGLADAAIILGILQILRGYRASIGDMMAGFRFVIPLVVATAIVNLPWTALGIVDQVWESEGDTESVVRWLLVYAIALVFYVHCAVATQAIVIERIGPVAGLVRSVRLTKGRRWAIFGLIMIPFVIVMVLYGGAAMVPELVAADEWLVDALDYFISATSTAYFAVLTTILYYDLRREKEGADSGELARVFD
jgi:hypothetical protein